MHTSPALEVIADSCRLLGGGSMEGIFTLWGNTQQRLFETMEIYYWRGLFVRVSGVSQIGFCHSLLLLLLCCFSVFWCRVVGGLSGRDG